MENHLNRLEKDILDTYDNGEWNEIPEMQNEIAKHKNYAKAALKKDKRVNIRISQFDLEALQRRAFEEGLPYQTLLASLIHKYVNGKLVDSHKS